MSSLKVNLDGLKKLGQTLAKFQGPRIQVGIFGQKNGRSAAGELRKRGGHTVQKGVAATETNAELGAIHEFGSKSRGIPARSFLRMPLTVSRKELMAQAGKDAAGTLFAGKAKLWLTRIGIAAENVVQGAFQTSGFGSWKPNAPSTIARKKSDKPLIDTAQLRRAIASRVVNA